MTDPEKTPKDERSTEEITDANRLKKPLTFQDQIDYIENNVLLSPGHQESTHTPEYTFLQELGQRLAVIKTNQELDPDTFTYTAEDWEKLEKIIEAKVLQMNINPATLAVEEPQVSSVMRPAQKKDDLGALYRNMRKTMDSIKSKAQPKT